MAILTIRTEGDPILRKTARPVEAVTPKIRQLLDDMLETMYDDMGVGIAGPQVGKLRRLITVDVGEGPYRMVNPEILWASEETQLDVEGCLSVPHFNGAVVRPQKVRVRYWDENQETKEVEAEGLFARCLCHEIDHLDGVLFRDRVEMEIDLEHPTDEQLAYMASHGLLPKEEEEVEELERIAETLQGDAEASESDEAH
ncbi:MAG: peptide deformylase [Peptoniphilaceae bacterium]|nr:peptide deformylase [Peptoniphilaceae bacterium]